MEPMLLEDFKCKEEPRSLLNLFEYFESNKLAPNKNDILAGLVYILMVESGFVPLDHKDSCDDYNFNYRRVLRFSKQLPNNWKKANVYSYSFVLPPFTLYECKVACIVVADDILVNCVVKGIEDGHFNAILDPLAYFTSSNTCIRRDKLQNLRYLSRLVKNEVFFPAKQAILRKNFIIANCLEELPPEIMLLIMSYLKIEDLVHLGQTNSFFYNLMRTPKLWMDRLRIDFQKNLPIHTYEQLRDYYKHSLNIKNRNWHRRIWLCR